MTPLPIVTQPEPDESWRSYLARVATAYHCTSETLGAHLGLRDAGRWPAHHGITLDSDRTRHAADILGLDPAQVTAMHLQRWDGIAIDIAALTGAAPRHWKIVPLSWTYLTHPRPCPDCLPQDGFEHLSWYLPLGHRTRHATLLGPGDDEVRRSSSPAARTVDLLRLLNADFANFAGEALQAPTALRAWLEAAVLVAASEARTDWRAPPAQPTRTAGSARPAPSPSRILAKTPKPECARSFDSRQSEPADTPERTSTARPCAI